MKDNGTIRKSNNGFIEQWSTELIDLFKNLPEGTEDKREELGGMSHSGLKQKIVEAVQYGDEFLNDHKG